VGKNNKEICFPNTINYQLVTLKGLLKQSSYGIKAGYDSSFSIQMNIYCSNSNFEHS